MKNKLTAFNWKVFKYLFWLSPVLIVMGITAGIIAGWQGIPVGLIGAGIGLAIAWVVLEGSSQQGFWGRRSTQEGTNALLATLAMLAILGLINFFAVRYDARLDLTENKIFTLAPQSQQVAQDLKQPVKLMIFMANPDPVDEELLKNYQRQNSQFSYEYVDPQAKPGVAQQFGVQSFGEVYLQSGETRRYIQTISAQERLSERKLTNGILQLSNASQQRVYVLQGHGERPLEAKQGGYSQAMAGLKEEGYLAQPLNLATDPTVPEDAEVLVIAGPQQAFLESEVNALKSYLQRKGGLLLLLDPQTDPKNPQFDFGLNPLLQDWGVKLNDRIIIDPAGQASGLGPGVTIVTQYGDSPITKGFNNGISFYPLARPLETIPTNAVESSQLLISSNQTEGQRLTESGELKFDPATDPTGPFNLGLALSRAVANSADAATDPNAPEPQARVVVIGNASFAQDGLFGQQLNGDVFLNSITWLSQQDDQAISIRPKEVTNRRIIMSPEQQISVALISLACLPLLAFVSAALVWWRRR
ncbi:MAG TPA: Gldg family protein [Allocoleopsis sp.]